LNNMMNSYYYTLRMHSNTHITDTHMRMQANP